VFAVFLLGVFVQFLVLVVQLLIEELGKSQCVKVLLESTVSSGRGRGSGSG